MTITKAKYVEMAEALVKARDLATSQQEAAGIDRSIAFISDVFARDNPRFSRDAFIIASQYAMPTGLPDLASRYTQAIEERDQTQALARADRDEAQAECARARAERDVAREERDEARKERDAYEQERDEYQGDVQDLTEERDTYERERDEVQGECDDLANVLKRTQDRLSNSSDPDFAGIYAPGVMVALAIIREERDQS